MGLIMGGSKCGTNVEMVLMAESSVHNANHVSEQSALTHKENLIRLDAPTKLLRLLLRSPPLLLGRCNPGARFRAQGPLFRGCGGSAALRGRDRTAGQDEFHLLQASYFFVYLDKNL